MPCFHGLAVSIHTPDGPLPEYSIQKQSRYHRITSYIPVPPPKVPEDSTTGKARQSTFAVSITLLTPGRSVPYSTPKPTPDDPHPSPKIVASLPGFGGSFSQGGKNNAVIGPYIPLTSSPIETVAAYIYFDGRAKEEVATLLRRGEETWVNSRWVSVPESEGGGLAEREFLFREVGLERWLNGLDLEGKDVQARIERRKKRLERKRRKKAELKGSDDDENDENAAMNGARASFGELLDRLRKPVDRHGVLRYGENESAPVETLSGDESLFTSDSDSDDDPPEPEAAGQIKIALFRVLASGEVRRGEYSPQFDAHDDDDTTEQNGSTDSNPGGAGGGSNGGSNGDGDVDHTTSFAKPKTLDPKKISTQTVTTIDMPDKPYAVFTFLYRGERQLRKMGILPPLPESKKPTPAKRKGNQIDFSNLAPLNPAGTKNFSGYREASSFPRAKKGSAYNDREKKIDNDNDDTMDSDADDDDDDDDDDDEKHSRMQAEDGEGDMKDEPKGMLSPEDAARQGELAEGVRKIKLKRQHSAEPLSASPRAARKSSAANSPAGPRLGSSSTPDPNNPTSSNISTSTTNPTSNTASSVTSNPWTSSQTADGNNNNSNNNSNIGSTDTSNKNTSPTINPTESIVGSPFKKQRASLPGFEENMKSGSGFGSGSGGDVGGSAGIGSGAGGTSEGTSGFGGPLSSMGGGGGSSGSGGNSGLTTTSTSDPTLPSARFNNTNEKGGGLNGGKDAMDLGSGSGLAGLGVNVGMGGSGGSALGDISTARSSSSGVIGKGIGGTGTSTDAGTRGPEPGLGVSAGPNAGTGATAPKVEDDEEL